MIIVIFKIALLANKRAIVIDLKKNYWASVIEFHFHINAF